MFKSTNINTIRFKEKKVHSLLSFENTAEISKPSLGLSQFVKSKFDKSQDSITQSRNSKGLTERHNKSQPKAI
jgi:hypothetical protein